ncbi:MAG: HAD family phosphatase [Clostridia bacterium]|nr:HAD family phosphatase [Clostridia bacterium]
MIRNVVFDMGNVLLRFEPELFMTRRGIVDPEDRDTVMREMFQSVEWVQMDMGILKEETAEPLILERIPERLRDRARDMLYHWWEPRQMLPGMERLVKRLKKAGYGIYLLSNASVHQPEYWESVPVSQLFDGTMISAIVKVIKPCPAIYRLFTEEFGLKEEECVFIDDSPVNVAGAVACGWKGIVFHGDPVETEEKLKALGLDF